MALTHKTLNIKMIDSFNFVPMSLCLPANFGLTELKKVFYPHLFNIPVYQNFIGPLQDVTFYLPDCMSTSMRNQFLNWHKEHENDVFNFQEEILAYYHSTYFLLLYFFLIYVVNKKDKDNFFKFLSLRSDVDILCRSCLEFCHQLISSSRVDPFR